MVVLSNYSPRLTSFWQAKYFFTTHSTNVTCDLLFLVVFA
jgi:hypothetical protein